MYLLLNTSSPVCKIILVSGEERFTYEWEANRELAKGLLAFLIDKTKKHGVSVSELRGIGVFRGPGSFTGLRIGAATVNTLAHFANIPVVGVTGDDWENQAKALLSNGSNHMVIVPEYGRPARITQPRK